MYIYKGVRGQAVKTVPNEKAFYFFSSVNDYTGEMASSIEDFLEKVKMIDQKSLEFHSDRRDFEKWIREVWRNEELAEEIRRIGKLNLKGERLRARFAHRLSTFLDAEKKMREEDLTKYPSPPEEHAYELKMEKRLQQLWKDKQKKKPI